jgi:DNA-directed RNA polymerase specialized sigma24 family protein
LGLQHDEIAEILHLSPQSSRALLSRTIQKIREAVGFNRGKVQQIISFLF